jgi:hypothetical protein
MGRGLAIGALFLCANAFAYTPTVSPGGRAVRWPGMPHLNMAGNPANQTGFPDHLFRSAIVRSLQRWAHASAGAVEFDYWQGTDPRTYEPNSSFNGLSSIYFASNAGRDGQLSPSVLGLTQVWYNTDNGQILETDTVLNDRDFEFTSDPTDTSGYGSGGGQSGNARPKVYIENVVTHELGHAYGLSHSGNLQATMLFMESPEQAHLGCDEQIGIRALYAPVDGARGRITGTVVSEGGAPVFGAHVIAVSQSRGVALAAAVTDRQGRYSLQALEPGTYYLMAEPFYAGSQALPAFYASLNPNLCGGQPYGRTLLTDGSGARLQGVSVGGGNGSTEAPALRARCPDRSSSSAVMATVAPLSTFDIGLQNGGFGVADQLGFFGSSQYRLRGVSGRLEIHVLSYSLYSPIRPRVSLRDAAGNGVNAQVFDTVYRGDSGYVNYDSAVVAEGLPAGDYVLSVSSDPVTTTNGTLSSETGPAG